MFTERSREKELLDLGPAYYDPDEYADCLKKLFQINKLMGFFRSTVNLLKRFSKESTLLDVGCGGGVFLLQLSKYFPAMRMLGTDISSDAIMNAQLALKSWQQKVSSVQVYFKRHEPEHFDILKNRFDIILATLVCHHLDNDELISFLKNIYLSATKAVIINDLHRSRVAYLGYKILSPLLFRNRLITHDGLISIRRGFKRSEWQCLLKEAKINNYQLTWCFPFRWKLILWK